ncbi:NAD(P)H-binding protein [Nocardia cyriacigeorgica]|uniref:SDR family oxidoreductase n=1 Tax=Nocardia cyriacigeorgica TaxID=135487 RepID=UPI0013B7538F|nr:NAD(P)H-binding protein [Nocardia cyriacigeorgica]NEW49811.1 NAD(P)H-binding protein [Nocardia cyriacigeorgica]
MTILVTGATGNIGRKVVDHLLARGATGVRALTNDPVKADLPAEVDVAEGYVRRLETLPAALDGVDRMYLAPAPDTVGEVLELARAAGVRHVVDLSGEPESWWGTVTGAVEASGLEWTHLWPGDFMENTQTWAQQIRDTGAVREPFPDIASAPIAMDDIAAVAAVALLDTDAHAGKAHWLAGPEILTRRELVRQLGTALGRDIEFLRVSRDEAVAALTPSMGENAEWYVDNVLGGGEENPTAPTESVEQLTGRSAITFAQWARANTAAFDV